MPVCSSLKGRHINGSPGSLGATATGIRLGAVLGATTPAPAPAVAMDPRGLATGHHGAAGVLAKLRRAPPKMKAAGAPPSAPHETVTGGGAAGPGPTPPMPLHAADAGESPRRRRPPGRRPPLAAMACEASVRWRAAAGGPGLAHNAHGHIAAPSPCAGVVDAEAPPTGVHAAGSTCAAPTAAPPTAPSGRPRKALAALAVDNRFGPTAGDAACPAAAPLPTRPGAARQLLVDAAAAAAPPAAGLARLRHWPTAAVRSAR